MKGFIRKILLMSLGIAFCLCGICAKTANAAVVDPEWIEVDADDDAGSEDTDDANDTFLIDAAKFPDAAFRAYLLSIFDYDEDGYVDLSEVTEIDVSYRTDIKSLKGIEYFTDLSFLSCNYMGLTALDVSANKKLYHLSCGGNKLTDLNVSANTELLVLYCGHNQLTALDVSKNTKLKQLVCADNKLTGLNVTKNLDLESLNCAYNNITALNLRENSVLTSLDLDYDKLNGTVDLSNSLGLAYLNLHFQELPKSGLLCVLKIKGCWALRNTDALDYSLTYQADEKCYGSLLELKNGNVYIYASAIANRPVQSSPLKATGIYHAEQSRNGIMAGLCTEGADKSNVVYSWYACRDGVNWITVQDWTRGNEWLDYKPDTFGDYVLVGKAGYIGSDGMLQGSIVESGSYFSYHPKIKGMCQMPYTGIGGGYLIGVESYDNPRQKYQYEMLILDCTLLAQGKDAWVYSTGRCGVSEGNAFWTVWQPKYGYYWTLFRVYDEKGNLIDETCYGFENI